MTMQCGDYQQQIPRAFFGDLSAEEQRGLDQHLAGCPTCLHEHECYAETLHVMRSAGDEPVPRHFFVYPQERAANPWQMFRAMLPRWQFATAGTAALFLLIGIVSLSGLRVRAEHGAWIISLGQNEVPAGLDVAALKADILRDAEERNREITREWVRSLHSEIEQSRSELTDQQRIQLATALNSLEARTDSRISLTANDLKGATQKSIVDLYQTLSQQQARNFTTISTRLDSALERSEARADQTDAILDTLLQIANQTIKQNGDQK